MDIRCARAREHARRADVDVHKYSIVNGECK